MIDLHRETSLIAESYVQYRSSERIRIRFERSNIAQIESSTDPVSLLVSPQLQCRD